MFQANLFKAKLVECNFTLSDIASEMGCNEVTLYRKLNGKSDFTRNEICIIRRKLGLTLDEMERIFFA